MLLLFFTEGTTCEVGALYFMLTGASGFFAVVLDEELKSLLKLRDVARETDTETHMRTQAQQELEVKG